MKSPGVFYIPSTDKIVNITYVQFYSKEETKTPCSIVTWVDENGVFPKTMIREDQFDIFVRIGVL